MNYSILQRQAAKRGIIFFNGDIRVSTSEHRYAGVLKFLHPQRGFGFITSAQGEDHFVHERDLLESGIDCDSLKNGVSRLSYNLRNDERNNKTKCVNLEILG
jgi:cold shock CspA family protein